MTAPTLPETMARLARLMPERVLMAEASHVIARVYGQPTPLLFSEVRDLDVLERALREECDARDWYWWVGTTPIDGLGYGQWYLAEVGEHSAQTGTPAHALALALLGALGGEGA